MFSQGGVRFMSCGDAVLHVHSLESFRNLFTGGIHNTSSRDQQI